MTLQSVSVIMINRNGGMRLRAALRSLRVDLDATWAVEPCFELVLVDNASSDGSVDAISRELEGALFPWQLVSEPVPGVNFARNAGLRVGQGELLIFIDSDLEFQHGWLRAYLTAARRNPSLSIFAGRVRIGAIEGSVPAWLDLTGPYRRDCVTGQTHFTDESVVLTDDAGPVGANMAFRRSVFAKHGEFDTQFGLRPGSLVAGAEAEFFNRLALEGQSFAYVADAVVDHPVRRSQLSKSYFLKRLHGTGRVFARMQRLRGVRPRRMCGLTLWVVRRLLHATLRYGHALASGCAKERFFYRGQLAILFGHLHEDFIEWHSARHASNSSEPLMTGSQERGEQVV